MEGKYQDHNESQPKGWNGLPQQTQTTGNRIKNGVGVRTTENAHRHTHKNCHKQCNGGQFDSCRNTLQYQLQSRHAIAEGVPEISLDRPFYKVGKLNQDGAVKPQFLAQALYLIGGGLPRYHQADRISGKMQ